MLYADANLMGHAGIETTMNIYAEVTDMNYVGIRNKYYEIPEEVITILFDKDGNKRLHI